MKNLKLLSALLLLVCASQAVTSDAAFATWADEKQASKPKRRLPCYDSIYDQNRADAQALIEEANSINRQWQTADVSSNQGASDFKKQVNFCDAVIQYCSWYKKNPSDHNEKYCDYYADNMRKKWQRLSSLLNGTAKLPVSEATRMKVCKEIPLPTMVKAKFLDKTCHDLVDEYGDLVQGNLQRVKESTRLTPEIKETPFYRSTDYEMSDMRSCGERRYKYYALLEARVKLMEEPYMNDLFKEFQKSGYTCEKTAKEIDKAFEAVETRNII